MLNVLIFAGLSGLAMAALASWRLLLPRIRGLLTDVRLAKVASETAAKLADVTYQVGRGSFDIGPQPGAPKAFPAGTWKEIGGAGKGWPRQDFYKVRGLACLDGVLYASLTGPRQDGPRGEVWSWDGERWHCIGGESGPWETDKAFVDHLTVFNGKLYAAVGRRVWRYASGAWDIAAVIPFDKDCGAYSFAEHDGRLCMSCWGRPAVFALSSDGRLDQLSDPPHGWGEGARTVYCLASFQGALYAGTGTGSTSGPGSSIFRFDGKSWEKVGGGGIRGSWSATGLPFVLGLAVFGSHLVAVLSRPAGTLAPSSSVWAFDGIEWRPIGVGRTCEGLARATILNDVVAHCGRLVVATGVGSGREAGAYALEDGCTWHDIVGDAFAPVDKGVSGGYWIYRLKSEGTRLFAAAAGHEGAAAVFEFVPKPEEEPT